MRSHLQFTRASINQLQRCCNNRLAVGYAECHGTSPTWRVYECNPAISTVLHFSNKPNISKQDLLCCPILGLPFQDKSKLFCTPTCAFEVKSTVQGNRRESLVSLPVLFFIFSPVLHLITSAIWHVPHIARPMNNIQPHHLTRWKCTQCTVGRIQRAEMQWHWGWWGGRKYTDTMQRPVISGSLCLCFGPTSGFREGDSRHQERVWGSSQWHLEKSKEVGGIRGRGECPGNKAVAHITHFLHMHTHTRKLCSQERWSVLGSLPICARRGHAVSFP